MQIIFLITFLKNECDAIRSRTRGTKERAVRNVRKEINDSPFHEEYEYQEELPERKEEPSYSPSDEVKT